MNPRKQRQIFWGKSKLSGAKFSFCSSFRFCPILTADWFAEFSRFGFAHPRTFYGVSERFAKPRIEIFTSFSSMAAPCEPSKAIRRLRTNRIAARYPVCPIFLFPVSHKASHALRNRGRNLLLVFVVGRRRASLQRQFVDYRQTG